MIRLSLSEEAFYEAALVNAANTQPMVNTIALRKPAAAIEHDLMPMRATPVYDSPLVWDIVFDGAQLEPGSTYLFVMHPHILRNRQGHEFVGPQTPAYSIVPTCPASKHMHLEPQSGMCVCDDGFVGAECDACAEGFGAYPNCEQCPPCVHGTCDSEILVCQVCCQVTLPLSLSLSLSLLLSCAVLVY
jgi:hypothetical protein